MTLQPGIKWISKTTYLNIETGKILTKKEATNKYKYIIIKTNKEVTINEHKTRGYIKYTTECKRQPQTKLNLD